jgi:hypothetical protein
MLKRIFLVFCFAFSLSACAPPVQQHSLSRDDIASFRIASVDVVATPTATISWPAVAMAHRGGEVGTETAYVTQEALKTLKQSYQHEFRDAVGGNHKVRVVVQVVNINMMSDNERAAQIALTGVAGGPLAMLAVAASPQKVGMLANVSLVDAATETVLASSPISSVIEQQKGTDPGPALFAHNAAEARKWLLTVR